ncbi:MAG: hypothetical protein HKN32_06825, partial [Flavobacteriales bacterium]|nr:hypothetical protein [Flavobacteriales bacterium]
MRFLSLTLFCCLFLTVKGQSQDVWQTVDSLIVARDFKEARKICSTQRSLNPNQLEATSWLARVASSEESWGEVLQLAETATGESGSLADSVRLGSAMGLALNYSGQNEKALQQMRALREQIEDRQRTIIPEFTIWMNIHAECLQNSGRTFEALEMLEANIGFIPKVGYSVERGMLYNSMGILTWSVGLYE